MGTQENKATKENEKECVFDLIFFVSGEEEEDDDEKEENRMNVKQLTHKIVGNVANMAHTHIWWFEA